MTEPPTPVLTPRPAAPPWLAPHARRLPGTGPVDPADWLWVLDDYAAQMAERERLLAECPALVHALQPAAEAPARELFDLVLRRLAERRDFRRDGDTMTCPDGRRVPLDRDRPLMTLGRLVQEDFCLLAKPDGGSEHRLCGAILCFPASWTLAEKLGGPMLAIHAPVAAYDATLARRVQRLLDAVSPERPLCRSNALFYQDPALFQPRREADPRRHDAGDAAWFRSERQCLVRLPDTDAVAFSIHTIVMRRTDLGPEDREALGTN